MDFWVVWGVLMVQAVIKVQKNIVIIEPIGELTRMHYLKDLVKKVEKYLNQDYRNFLIDFSNVTGIDSPGLGILFSMYKIIFQEDGKMVVCNIPERLRRVFEVMSFNSVIPTVETQKEASNWFAENAQS